MEKYLNQICLVSGQNVAELLGCILPNARALNIHALVTRQMRTEAEYLQKACRKFGVKCHLHQLEKIDVSVIEELLDKIWFNEPDENWIVNITGGTKIMSLAAYGWAVRNNIPVFYVDTENRSLLLNKSSAWATEILPDLLNYESLLNLYGYDVKSVIKASVPPDIRATLDRLIAFTAIAANLGAIRALNFLAQSARDKPDLAIAYSTSPNLEKILAICREAGKLDYDASQICFTDETARKWCNGIWLEEYVQSVLVKLESEGKIASWASSVQIMGAGGKNELDAVFTAHNRLHVIECKTAKLNFGEREAAGSILYKADSLRGRIGGIFARSMLCSLDPLSQADALRAKNLGILTVIGLNLKNLSKILMEWSNEA